MDPLSVAKHESREDAYEYACLDCDAYFNGKEQHELYGCPGCGSQNTVPMNEYIENKDSKTIDESGG